MVWSGSLAFIGLAFIGCSLVLSLRSRHISSVCKGLSRQLRLHHFVSLAGMVAIFAHVFLEVLSLSNPTWADVFLLEIWLDPAMALGLIALLGFLALGLLARHLALSHRTWLWVHRSNVLFVIMALAHGVLFQDDPLRLDPLPAIVFFGTGIAALGAVLGWIWVPSQRRLRVLSAEHLGSGLWEVMVDPLSAHPVPLMLPVAQRSLKRVLPIQERKLEYPAGSVVYVRFPCGSFTGSWHPLSVASCRNEPALRLIIRSCGRDTGHLQDLRRGDVLSVRGPFLDMQAPLGSKQGDVHQVWLAAGVGVAPFIGLLHCRAALNLRRVCLVHFDRNPLERDLIQRICESLCNASTPVGAVLSLEVRPAFKEGKLHRSEADIIAEIRGEFPDSRYKICGSPGFMRLARRTLHKLGVPSQLITTEEFVR
jgi:predicted ferric reductase